MTSNNSANNDILLFLCLTIFLLILFDSFSIALFVYFINLTFIFVVMLLILVCHFSNSNLFTVVCNSFVVVLPHPRRTTWAMRPPRGTPPCSRGAALCPWSCLSALCNVTPLGRFWRWYIQSEINRNTLKLCNSYTKIG